MRYNTYTTKQSVVLDGPFSSATGVVISGEMGASKSTTATKALTRPLAATAGAAGAPAPTTRFDFDFGDALLFGWIDRVSYTVVTESGFVHHVARPPNGTAVAVELALVDALGIGAPRSATVQMTVTQAL